ncbi:NADH-quinone oxidoreductase subunit NuoN [Pelagibacterium limicola]|uniref:NADH-quinone oxidoreductase subunit NuoN n=1 Tax=Pelagibacterium limicola TaxID=2791022 RepID=UPI0018AF58DB|nr:NADH-quinone oxidoreductase subunit NuoN [Pelagibacterium limicola]
MTSEFAGFASLAPAYPEMLLAVGALALLMIGVFVRFEASRLVTILAVGLLAVAGAMILISSEGTIFSGGFINDGFARFMKTLIIAGSVFALILTFSTAADKGLNKFEYPVLVILATLGMMMMVSANDLMSLYVGLELQSLSLYVVAAFRRDSGKATEAGLKYFVLGALSSGMLLYGASLVYGFTGHTQLDRIAEAVALGERNVGVIFGLVFLLAGIAFKISAVPFHMWTPDVYEGAPTPVTAFFASAPKVAAIALLIRVVFDAFEPIARDWQQVVIFLSIASMVLASFAAIGQNNLKRLLAYSSIGHVGFALVGLSAGSLTGVEGVAIYMAVYLTMTVGTFACVLALKNENGYVQTIEDLAGLSRNRPFVAGMLAMFMFSLVGLPPLAGFFAKWYVFLAAVEAQLFVLAVIGMLASAVSAFYYLRVIKVMYFDEPTQGYAVPAIELRVVIALTGFLVLSYYFTVGAPLAEYAHNAAGSLF